ncbi:MAG: Ig-like domain-containing protein [Gemmatimonadaceae bacterium]
MANKSSSVAMMPRLRRVVLHCLKACAIVTALACNDDSPTFGHPAAPVVYVCHAEGTSAAAVVNVELPDLAAHRAHGDYVAVLTVDRTSAEIGDSIHFRTITDALASARAVRVKRSETESAVCRITINVAAGTQSGSTAASTDPTFERFPIVIDVPKISVVGAFRMEVDAQARATGVSTNGAATIIVPTPALIIPGTTSQTAVSEEIFVVNSHVNGSKGDDAIIEGFIMCSGHAVGDTVRGGQGVLALRAQNLTIRGNKFEGNFTERIDLRASSGTVERNHSSGLGVTCDICLAGPGSFVVRDNRIMEGGGVPGVLMVPATLLPVPTIIEQFTLPDQASIIATITNNEVRGHQSVPVGVGIRVGAMGVFAPNVVGSSTATISGNSLVNNRFGIILEAAFPVIGGSLRGDLDITTSGNTFSGSCENNFYVAFARHATGLGLNTQAYLKNSTYKLTLGTDVPFASAWYANPAGNGNTLIVNGATIANGTKHSYDTARLCSTATGADTTSKIVEKTTTIESGDAQTAEVATLLPKPLRVVVRTGTVPRVGITVQWTTVSGTLSSATSVTDATGVATVNWTLGTTSGAQSATATVDGTVSAMFGAIGVASAPIITKVRGDNQQVDVTGVGLIPLRVKLVDRFGNAVACTVINWAVLSGPIAVNFEGSGAVTECFASMKTTGGTGEAHTRATLADGTFVEFLTTVN